jgi:hypothetical protein
MTTRPYYPVQSRLVSADEKEQVEKLARNNGLSVSNAIRLVLLQAAREGWTLRIGRQPRKTA